MRFPGFEGEWREATLGKCSTLIDYGMNAAAKKFDGVNKYIRITDINDQTSLYESSSPVSPDGELSEKYLVKENDILFARTGASTGKSYLYDNSDGKLFFAGFLIRVHIDSRHNARFVFTQTQTISYLKWVELMSMRSGQPGINAQEYASYKFYLPTKAEQDKISSLIFLLDRRIQTQNKIIGELNVFKTTITKRLFSGKLKFKDDSGSHFPIWECKALGEVGQFTGGGTPSSSNANFWNGNIPWISSSDLSEGNIHSINITRYITESAIINSATKLCVAPLILIVSRVGVGKVAFSEKPLCTSQDFLNMHNFSCSGPFLTYLLSIEMKKTASRTQGTSIKGISSAEIKTKRILLPCIAEQIKIVDILHALDNKIDIEVNVLRKMEAQKHYLLQNLFI